MSLKMYCQSDRDKYRVQLSFELYLDLSSKDISGLSMWSTALSLDSKRHVQVPYDPNRSRYVIVNSSFSSSAKSAMPFAKMHLYNTYTYDSQIPKFYYYVLLFLLFKIATTEITAKIQIPTSDV
jgi:hypothetical protein